MTLSMDRPEQKQSASRARPYTLTGGRTRARVEVPIEAPVEALLSAGELDCAPGDIPAVIVRLCGSRPSIAEISALWLARSSCSSRFPFRSKWKRKDNCCRRQSVRCSLRPMAS